MCVVLTGCGGDHPGEIKIFDYVKLTVSDVHDVALSAQEPLSNKQGIGYSLIKDNEEFYNKELGWCLDYLYVKRSRNGARYLRPSLEYLRSPKILNIGNPAISSLVVVPLEDLDKVLAEHFDVE